MGKARHQRASWALAAFQADDALEPLRHDIGPATARGALEMFFRLEGEIGLKPVETDEGTGIVANPKVEGSQKLSQALKAWKFMRGRLEAGKVSEEEYKAWKASFRG